MAEREPGDLTEANLDRVYGRVKLACGIAIVLLVLGAVLKTITGVSLVVSHGLILLALGVMALSAVHVVVRTDFTPRASPALLIGGMLIFCSQLLAVTGMLPALSDWPLLGAGVLQQAVRQIFGWVGVGLLIASFYLSLAEAVIARMRMEHQREQLQQTSAELKAARDDLELRVRERTEELTTAVENLRRSEERFSQVAASAGDWIWELDKRGRYTFCSQGVELALGRKPEDLIGKNYREFETTDGPSLDAWIEAGEGFSDVDVQAVHADGSFVHHRSSGFPVCAADGQLVGFRGTSRDVTRQRLLEEQIQEVRRLESLGQLASGVAHDFNNLITVMMSCCEQLQSMLAEDDEAMHVVEVVRETAEQATSVTRSLLSFGQQSGSDHRPLNLNVEVSQACRLLRRVLPARVRLTVEVDPEQSLWIEADSQLQQVLINLAVNARDAMAEGGNLIVGSREVGDQVELFVKDEGEGMASEVRSQIFEPFFTTKPRGQGTGLGMAIVQSIVREYGGEIDVESAEGAGTTVRIRLPRVASPKTETVAPATDQATHVERVLLVENNKLIRGLLTSQLRGLKYEVTATATGRQFQEALQSLQDVPTLIILDLDLPDGCGLDFLAEARQSIPECPTIVITGQSHEDLRDGVDDNIYLLPKPFDAQQLAEMVSEVRNHSLALESTQEQNRE